VEEEGVSEGFGGGGGVGGEKDGVVVGVFVVERDVIIGLVVGEDRGGGVAEGSGRAEVGAVVQGLVWGGQTGREEIEVSDASS
jgi:hypothetical protein